MYIMTFIFLLTLVLRNSVYVMMEITKGENKKISAAINTHYKDKITRSLTLTLFLSNP